MTISEVVDGATQLSTLALDAASVPDPTMTVSRVTDLAVKLIPCAGADMVRVTAAGELRVMASSDPGLSDLTVAAWQRWPHLPLSAAVHGPCRTENHGSGYPTELRAGCGIVSEWMFAMQIGTGTHHGSLRFLFRDKVSQSSPAGRLAAAFAIQAAIAVDRAASQLAVTHLQTAIDTNRDIGAAVGILMARQGIGYQAAFHLLRAESQNKNRKLRDVAAEILTTTVTGPRDPGRLG
jgi:hypothetical protein